MFHSIYIILNIYNYVKLIMTGLDNNNVAHRFNLNFINPGYVKCIINYTIEDSLLKSSSQNFLNPS